MLTGVTQYEKFFRAAASLDIDKSDIRRIDDLMNRKLRDVLIMARRAAKMNGRDIIREADLPITKGIEERMQHFDKLDIELHVSEILARQAELPPLGMELDAEVEAQLPRLLGALIIAVAELCHVVDPHVKNPSSKHFDGAEKALDILL